MTSNYEKIISESSIRKDDFAPGVLNGEEVYEKQPDRSSSVGQNLMMLCLPPYWHLITVYK